MEIYVVQYGDNINSIADKYGITVERLVSDNGLNSPYTLVVGQTLVILNPTETDTVREGDTLEMIAERNHISMMELIRNNPFLYDREYIYPGDTLAIRFNTIKDIQMNGYTSAFISEVILNRSLPYMTYISIFNYQLADDMSIISLGNDTIIIERAKQYDTIPLLMVSTLSPTGDINIETIYRLLLDIDMQDDMIHEIVEILRAKEYMGVNLLISSLADYNQSLYLNLIVKISERLKNDGYIIMVTISPYYSTREIDQNIDYHSISLYVDRIIFLQNIWVKKNQPPAPISNISLIRLFIEDVVSKVSPSYISLGKPLVGYDWVIPYDPSRTAILMSLDSTLILAAEYGAVIHLDEVSQTPYYNYTKTTAGTSEDHLVWFIDANSIAALDEVVIDYGLAGTGIWNITRLNQQLFSMSNATYNIVKYPVRS